MKFNTPAHLPKHRLTMGRVCFMVLMLVVSVVAFVNGLSYGLFEAFILAAMPGGFFLAMLLLTCLPKLDWILHSADVKDLLKKE